MERFIYGVRFLVDKKTGAEMGTRFMNGSLEIVCGDPTSWNRALGGHFAEVADPSLYSTVSI